MNFLVKKRDIRIFISLFLLFLYSFTTGLSSHIYVKSSITIPLSFLVAIVLTWDRGYSKTISRMNLIAIVMLLIILFWGNKSISNHYYISIYFTLAYIGFYIVSQKYCDWHGIFLRLLIATSVIYALLTIYCIISPDFFYGKVIPTFESYGAAAQSLRINYDNGFVAGFTPNTGLNAIYIVVGLGCVVVGLITGRYKKVSVSSVAAVVMVVALLATGKRAHFFFSLISLFVVYYFLNCNHPAKRIFKILFAIVFLVGFIFVLNDYIPFIANNIQAWIVRFSSDNIDTGRNVYRDAALSLFFSNPLFGIGWDGTKYAFVGILGKETYVHNVFIQLLTEVGIVGSIPFFAFFILSVKHVIHALKKIVLSKDNAFEVPISLAYSLFFQVFFLLYCLTGNPLYDASTLLPYMLSCAIGEYYYNKIIIEESL